MIENRFISILLGLNKNEIIKGINEIESKFGKNLLSISLIPLIISFLFKPNNIEMNLLKVLMR